MEQEEKNNAIQAERKKREAKLRFAGLTKAQQREFDSYTVQQKKYVLFRAQGYDRTNAYKMTGYQGENGAQNGYNLEKKVKPGMVAIIEALQRQHTSQELVKKDSKVNQQIDKVAMQKTVPPELMATLGMVPEDQALVDYKDIDPAKMSQEQAKNLQFYRNIAEGKTKSVKITKTFDADGKLTGTKKEESISIEDRVKAQKEFIRLIGGSEVVELGSVSAGNNINIMIVDASRKDLPEDGKKVTQIDGETVLLEEVEEREPKRTEVTEDGFDGQTAAS